MTGEVFLIIAAWVALVFVTQHLLERRRSRNQAKLDKALRKLAAEAARVERWKERKRASKAKNSDGASPER